MSDNFDPEEIAEIEARFERVAREELVTICYFAEMSYETAKELVLMHKAWDADGDIEALLALMEYLDNFLSSLAEVLDDSGLTPES